MRWAYAVTTYASGPMLQTTLASIPEDSRVLVVDTRTSRWPLARSWNHAVDTLLEEGFDAVIVMNDDVVLRPDTGELLAWGLLEGQFMVDRPYVSDWGAAGHPELLLLSARHAANSDACTDVPDWDLLHGAEPKWQPGPDFSTFCVGHRFREVVGRFDEGFELWFEDNDTHRRIRMAGCEAGALAPYWHFRNGTIRTDRAWAAAATAPGGTFERSKRRYAEKWGAPFDAGSPLGRETLAVPRFGDGVLTPAATS